jgi:hypothetical protein
MHSIDRVNHIDDDKLDEPIFVQYDEELLEHNNPFFALSEWQIYNELDDRMWLDEYY